MRVHPWPECWQQLMDASCQQQFHHLPQHHAARIGHERKRPQPDWLQRQRSPEWPAHLVRRAQLLRRHWIEICAAKSYCTAKSQQQRSHLLQARLQQQVVVRTLQEWQQRQLEWPAHVLTRDSLGLVGECQRSLTLMVALDQRMMSCMARRHDDLQVQENGGRATLDRRRAGRRSTRVLRPLILNDYSRVLILPGSHTDLLLGSYGPCEHHKVLRRVRAYRH